MSGGPTPSVPILDGGAQITGDEHAWELGSAAMIDQTLWELWVWSLFTESLGER